MAIAEQGSGQAARRRADGQRPGQVLGRELKKPGLDMTMR